MFMKSMLVRWPEASADSDNLECTHYSLQIDNHFGCHASSQIVLIAEAYQ